MPFATESKVELRAVIATDSKTKDLVVLGGDSGFSQSAIIAIRKWRFHPEMRQGQPAETTYKVHVRFNPMLREANSNVELESPIPETPSVSPLAKQDFGPEIHHMSEPGMVTPNNSIRPSPSSPRRQVSRSSKATSGSILWLEATAYPGTCT
jgi:Gram-negative bacterial TonB protein C-terminal